MAGAARESPPQVFDGGLSGSTQVGQAKDIPLMEKNGENTHTSAGVYAGTKALAGNQKTRRVWFCSQERDE